jgi:hypothetical protein
MCRGQKRPIQHGWNVLWSEKSESAWLERVAAGKDGFSMAGMWRGPKRKIQHDWNVL